MRFSNGCSMQGSSWSWNTRTCFLALSGFWYLGGSKTGVCKPRLGKWPIGSATATAVENDRGEHRQQYNPGSLHAPPSLGENNTTRSVARKLYWKHHKQAVRIEGEG